MAFWAQTSYDVKRKIWKGPDFDSVFNPNISIGQAVLHMLNLWPDKVVQINDTTGQTLTGREMRLLSIRAAQNLRRMGCEENDVLGIIGKNTHFLAPLMFGAFLSGTPLSTMDPSFNKGEIKHMLGITKPKIIFCDDEKYEEAKQALHELNSHSAIYLMTGSVKGVPSVDEIFTETGEEKSFIPPKLSKGGDHTATILCSSGTTGLLKGVIMSHRSLLYQNEVDFTNSEVLLCFSTVYWVSGLFTLITGTLNGCTRIISHQIWFSPELFLHLIEKYKVTILFTPPSEMALAVQCPDIKFRDLSSVQRYICGGSAVPQVLSKEMQRYITCGDVLIGYGMSEVCGTTCFETPDCRRMGSVGKLYRGTEIKIVDDNGKQLGVNEKGEIFIKRQFNCFGYYENVQATKLLHDSDGWIHSGDLGYFDEDGFLFIVDRKKEILKYKNFHYYPTEIEAVIMEIPDVVDVCVFGVPDLIATDLPAAAVIKKDGSELSKDDVYKYVAEKMVHFKQLRGGVYFVISLPKTASGKIIRRKVKENLTKPDVVEKMLDK